MPHSRGVGCLVTKLYLTLCDSMEAAHQARLTMGFPGREYWRGLPFDLFNPGIKPKSLALAGKFCTTEPPVAQYNTEVQYSVI